MRSPSPGNLKKRLKNKSKDDDRTCFPGCRLEIQRDDVQPSPAPSWESHKLHVGTPPGQKPTVPTPSCNGSPDQASARQLLHSQLGWPGRQDRCWLMPMSDPCPFSPTPVVGHLYKWQIWKFSAVTLVLTRLLLASGVPESSSRGLFTCSHIKVMVLDLITLFLARGFPVVEPPKDKPIRGKRNSLNGNILLLPIEKGAKVGF